MKELVYTEATGLQEVDDLNEFLTPYPAGTYVHGIVNARTKLGWYKRVWNDSSLGGPYLYWEPVNPRQLPKKLKTWALVMGIPL